jgi:hypothetical protein
MIVLVSFAQALLFVLCLIDSNESLLFIFSPNATKELLDKLKSCFPIHGIFDALKVIYL